MKNYNFGVSELIEASKESVDEFGHTVYDDLAGISERCFFHIPKEEAIYRLSANLVRHMRIHRHNPHSDIIHLSIKTAETKLSHEESYHFINEDKKGLIDINPKEFLRAFKMYERKIAEAIDGDFPEQNWHSMQYVLSLFLKR